MKLTYEEAVELLRGLMHVCLESSVSEFVEDDEQHVYNLIASTLRAIIPVFEGEIERLGKGN